MEQPVIYVMRGLPGSGKSTQARELSKRIGAEVVNRDALRLALLLSLIHISEPTRLSLVSRMPSSA